jgi:hypothetical protein
MPSLTALPPAAGARPPAADADAPPPPSGGPGARRHPGGCSGAAGWTRRSAWQQQALRARALAQAAAASAAPLTGRLPLWEPCACRHPHPTRAPALLGDAAGLRQPGAARGGRYEQGDEDEDEEGEGPLRPERFSPLATLPTLGASSWRGDERRASDELAPDLEAQLSLGVGCLLRGQGRALCCPALLRARSCRVPGARPPARARAGLSWPALSRPPAAAHLPPTCRRP